MAKYSLGGGVASGSASTPHTAQRFSLVFRLAAAVSFAAFACLGQLEKSLFDSRCLEPPAASAAVNSYSIPIGSLSMVGVQQKRLVTSPFQTCLF
jgi:hypothetical protein